MVSRRMQVEEVEDDDDDDSMPELASGSSSDEETPRMKRPCNAGPSSVPAPPPLKSSNPGTAPKGLPGQGLGRTPSSAASSWQKAAAEESDSSMPDLGGSSDDEGGHSCALSDGDGNGGWLGIGIGDIMA
jgi:hypothetical protein